MIRKKSLNDIAEQRDRCWELNKINNGNRNRYVKILEAGMNARVLRGLSRFDKDRDVKK